MTRARENLWRPSEKRLLRGALRWSSTTARWRPRTSTRRSSTAARSTQSACWPQPPVPKSNTHFATLGESHRGKVSELRFGRGSDPIVIRTNDMARTMKCVGIFQERHRSSKSSESRRDHTMEHRCAPYTAKENLLSFRHSNPAHFPRVSFELGASPRLSRCRDRVPVRTMVMEPHITRYNRIRPSSKTQF